MRVQSSRGVSTDDSGWSEASARQLWPSGRNRRRARDRHFGVFRRRELVRLELKPIVIDAHEGAQYACIERIGLGELASSAGEIACLAPAVLRFRLAVANSNLMLSSDSLESGTSSSNLLRSTIQSIVFCFSKNRFRLRFGQR
jgi:hypothetical protein